MNAVLAVALGGAVGATARYFVYVMTGHYLGTAFPYATLIVNVLGSFILGALTSTMALVWSASNEARLFFAVGIMGSFTTFSTFSLDFVTLYERDRWDLCALYVVASVLLSIAAMFAGLYLVRRMLAPEF
jgi:CrcB protein